MPPKRKVPEEKTTDGSINKKLAGEEQLNQSKSTTKTRTTRRSRKKGDASANSASKDQSNNGLNKTSVKERPIEASSKSETGKKHDEPPSPQETDQTLIDVFIQKAPNVVTEKSANGQETDNRPNEKNKDVRREQLENHKVPEKSIPTEVNHQHRVKDEPADEKLDNNDREFTEHDEKTEKIERLREDMPSSVLEKGHIYFFYRPKINATHPQSPKDVQRLYMILLPISAKPTLADEKIEAAAQIMEKDQLVENQQSLGKPRLLIVTKKKLPEVGSHARYWGFVDKVFGNLEEITGFLDEAHYETETRGERTVQAARPLAKGVYAILEHNNHSQLAYVLELPKEPGDVQQAFNINREASYIISIKNPQASNPQSAGLSQQQKPEFPAHLMEKFQGRRFITMPTTEYLDYHNCEFILIGAHENIAGPLGAPGEHLEEWAEEEAMTEIPDLGKDVIFKELKIEMDQLPAEALRGLWESDTEDV